MPKISVIIPCYNTATWLASCIQSIQKQSFTDIEIICINDASTDNSLSILKKLAQNDKRIIVVDLLTNHGVSIARNIGINISSGKYISFIDSDDLIGSDFYTQLYRTAEIEEADIIKSASISIDENNQPIQIDNINPLILKNKGYFLSQFWSAIYKKDLIEKFNIKFPEKLIRGQDRAFLLKAVMSCQKISVNDSVHYIYRRRTGSSDSKKLSIKKIESNLFCFDDILSFASNISELDPQLHALQCYSYIQNCISDSSRAVKTEFSESSKLCAKKIVEIYDKCLAQNELTHILKKEIALLTMIRNNDIKGLMTYSQLSIFQRLRYNIGKK
mgnify:CR=1 FL=1